MTVKMIIRDRNAPFIDIVEETNGNYKLAVNQLDAIAGNFTVTIVCTVQISELESIDTNLEIKVHII